MHHILLVDDDSDLLQSLVRVLSRLVAPYTICAATDLPKALELLNSSNPLIAVIDLCIDELSGVESGFDLLRQMKARRPDLRVLVLTGHGATANGIRALRLGAASFLEKPVDPEHLAVLLRDAIAHVELRREVDRLSKEERSSALSELCGESDAVKRLRDEVAFAAQTPQPLLLLGETGTGKGVCARLIHQLGPRGSKRFVHYHPNFGGGDIVQSELFGHTKGAFTGAVEARRGLALEADGGTLFIDELDSIPKDTQVLLLDLVQERRVRAVGADSYQSASCRFIAATNKPAAELLSAGTVREDLHHRLAHNVIHIPPLRNRLSDIPTLVERFLDKLRARDGINVFEVSAKLSLSLQSHTWPGNIRELQGLVDTAAYRAHFCGRSVIDLEDARFGGAAASAANNSATVDITNFNQQVESFKRELVRRALDACGGNQLQAAAMLGIDRGTVSRLK